jgi:hypothetical protein
MNSTSLLASVPVAHAGLLYYIAVFFTGAFFCNCVPHLVAGLQGLPFPTPFAQPHGVGFSSPLINMLWGFFYLLAGCYLLSQHPVTLGVNAGFIGLALGALLIGIFSALHFGKVQQARNHAAGN